MFHQLNEIYIRKPRAGYSPCGTLVGVDSYRFVIEQGDDGLRVDEFLARRFPLLSATKLRALVGAGAVTRERVALSIGQRLSAGQTIEFTWDPGRVPVCPPEAMLLEVLFEDAHLLAVNKPTGMLVHPTRGVKRGTLTNGLLAHLNPGLDAREIVRGGGELVLWPRFVHRLDRDTSGVILAAKTKESARALGKSLAAGRFTKAYLAILHGTLRDARLRIEHPIRRFDDGPPYWRASADGQAALSCVETLATGNGLSLVRMAPRTGRTNQLRIHAAAAGHPIVGDTVYGGHRADGLMLHAWILAFPHPVFEERLVILAPVPARLRGMWPGIDEVSAVPRP